MQACKIFAGDQHGAARISFLARKKYKEAQTVGIVHSGIRVTVRTYYVKNETNYPRCLPSTIGKHVQKDFTNSQFNKYAHVDLHGC